MATGTVCANVDSGINTYIDLAPFPGNFYYQVTAVYGNGESEPSNEASVVVTGVYEKQNIEGPVEFMLAQNYPNPFNPVTTIQYVIPSSIKSQAVELGIFNILGEKIKTLVDEKQRPGHYTIQWNGRDDFGVQVPSGVYLYSLRTGSFMDVKRMLLLK